MATIALLQPGDPEISRGGAEWRPDATPAAQRLAEKLARGGPAMPLMSVHYEIQQPPALEPRSPQPASGRRISDLVCTRPTDASSPRLYDLCLQSRPLGSGARQPTLLYIMSPSTLLEISLRDAVISQVIFSADGGGAPTESFTLLFTEILWRFENLSGGAPPISAGWSLLRDRPIAIFTD